VNILAADIGGTTTKMAICHQDGTLSDVMEYATESMQGGPHVVERLLLHMEQYKNYDAIAISTAGQVNVDEGTIVYANENIPNYTGTKLAEIVQARFGKPVKVENDVNAAALGEARFGAAKAHKSFLCLTFGTGIGGAIVMNRKIYRGADGVAAEFGHMFTHAWNSSETSPRKSFYEHHASTTALIRLAKEYDQQVVDGKQLFGKIKNGDEKLKAVLDEWVNEVSVGLASLIHIFNPSAIIVGGGVMEQDFLVRLVEQQTKQLIMPSYMGVCIRKAELGNKAGLIGAASHFFD